MDVAGFARGGMSRMDGVGFASMPGRRVKVGSGNTAGLHHPMMIHRQRAPTTALMAFLGTRRGSPPV